MTSPSQRCAKMWNGSEMRQLLPYMPDSLWDIITSAALLWLTTLTTTFRTTKLKAQPCKWCPAPFEHPRPARHFCSPPRNFCLLLRLPASSRDPFTSDLSMSWFYLCWHVDAQPSHSSSISSSLLKIKVVFGIVCLRNGLLEMILITH